MTQDIELTFKYTDREKTVRDSLVHVPMSYLMYTLLSSLALKGRQLKQLKHGFQQNCSV